LPRRPKWERLRMEANMSIEIFCGDVTDILSECEDETFTACFCDPPYGLTANKKGGSGEKSLNLNSPAGRSRITTGGGFMGRKWDSCVPGVPYWAEILRVLKPGAVLLAFGGTRTHHRLMCAIEDAGFEIYDTLMWLYGSGFPKSYDISKAIDKAAGAEREVVGTYRVSGNALTSTKDKGGTYGVGVPNSPPGNIDITAPATPDAVTWDGYGTALKPAWEPIVLARKPRTGTYAQMAVEHGTAALNIDGTRISHDEPTKYSNRDNRAWFGVMHDTHTMASASPAGRWPANLLLDEEAAAMLDAQAGKQVSRFFYCSKASKRERNDGLDSTRTVKYDMPQNQGGRSWQGVTTALVQSLRRATSESMVTWLIGESGASIMGLCHEDFLSTILTEIGKITESKIYNSLMQQLINESIADVSCVMESGGNLAMSVESSSLSTKITGISQKRAGLSMDAVKSVISELLSLISVEENWQELRNIHSTVKPVALCEYLARLIVPPEAYRDEAKLLVPFSGVASEMIGAWQAGWRNIVGIELSEEYCEIARIRLEHWRSE